MFSNVNVWTFITACAETWRVISIFVYYVHSISTCRVYRSRLNNIVRLSFRMCVFYVDTVVFITCYMHSTVECITVWVLHIVGWGRHSISFGICLSLDAEKLGVSSQSILHVSLGAVQVWNWVLLRNTVSCLRVWDRPFGGAAADMLLRLLNKDSYACSEGVRAPWIELQLLHLLSDSIAEWYIALQDPH